MGQLNFPKSAQMSEIGNKSIFSTNKNDYLWITDPQRTDPEYFNDTNNAGY
jgi:hypothetical protein